MTSLGVIKWHQITISLFIGIALGTAFGHWQAKSYLHTRWEQGGMKQHMLERFNRELHLTAEQQKEIAAIFDAKYPQMVALQAEMKPKFEALRNSTQAEIRKILNSKQQEKFDEMHAKMENRWKEHRKFFGSAR